MSSFGRIYDAIFLDGVSLVFSAVIVFWLALSIIFLLYSARRDSPIAVRFISITPNSLATIGVLGTFTGILIGLLDFNVDQIDNSVPNLLAGLKVAFTTSIVGIAAAIIFRVVKVAIPSGPSTTGMTADDIHSILSQIRDDARAASNASLSHLADVRNAISADGDSSLLTQIQKLRTSVQDGQIELITEFREFAKHMTENNQKAIIEALEQVIRDFNEKLTEQFGENFKELNSAVTSLVDWQENYRTHVESLEARIEMAVTAVQTIENALNEVRMHSEQIPVVIRPLGQVLDTLQAQTEHLTSHLEGLAELREKAVTAFPVIESNLETMTTGFTSSVDDAVKRLSLSANENQQALDEIRNNYKEMLKGTLEAREAFSVSLNKTMDGLNEQAEKRFEEHGKLIEVSAKDAQRILDEARSKSIEQLNTQFEEFDKQMQEELKRSLELMGKQLGSLSEKFVKDYTPLTDNLQSLLSVARSAAE